MLIKKASDIKSSEITPKSLYLNRRKFLAGTQRLPALRRWRAWGCDEMASPSVGGASQHQN